MTDITIPPEALEKAARAAWERKRDAYSTRRKGRSRSGLRRMLPVWQDLHPTIRQHSIEEARAACLAMLDAWPNMSRIDRVTQNDSPVPGFSEPFIILPLQQKEPTND